MSERDLFEFFADVGRLYRARYLFPTWGRYVTNKDEPLQDKRKALAIFLWGYAYERQGAARDYAYAAAETVLRAPDLTTDAIWREYIKKLARFQEPGTEEPRANVKANPLAPKNTKYVTKKGEYKTIQDSVIERFGPEGKETIIGYAKTQIEQRRIKDAFQRIIGVNGVGEKIASFFLRDVASYYGLFEEVGQCENVLNRELLQPVDIWIGRISEISSVPKPKKDAEARRNIVTKSLEYGVLPESFNQGAWYFAAQIARSKIWFYEILDRLKSGEKDEAKQMVDEHVETLSAVFETWLRD